MNQYATTKTVTRQAPPVALLATALCLAGLMAVGDAAAQSATPERDQQERDAEESSVEQGQTPLDESFGVRDHREWVRETRRKAWADTAWDVQFRTFYLDRDKFDDTKSESWAIGGSAGFKTGYFRERFAFGATGYTSQRLHGDDDEDGALLLQPGQEGYTVLGQLYGEFLFNEDTHLNFGRLSIDTPYINRNDVRMTPNTFEAITVQGLYGGDEGGSEWRVGAGYFDEIKERNSDEFVSMSVDAGASVERGVYAAGANYKKGPFSLGAIDYYSNDIINIFYTEAKYDIPLAEKKKLKFSLQYSDQDSTGDDLLKGTSFSSHQWGGKGELEAGGALFTLAYTSTDGDTNMQNPWSGYPGYTSVQVEDFNRDGEDAWLARASYNFKSLKGLSVYGLYVDGSSPDDPTQFAKEEYDLNLQFAPPEGVLKGLLVRVRYANVQQDDPGGSELSDLRFMVYYDPPSL